MVQDYFRKTFRIRSLEETAINLSLPAYETQERGALNFLGLGIADDHSFFCPLKRGQFGQIVPSPLGFRELSPPKIVPSPSAAPTWSVLALIPVES